MYKLLWTKLRTVVVAVLALFSGAREGTCSASLAGTGLGGNEDNRKAALDAGDDNRNRGSSGLLRFPASYLPVVTNNDDEDASSIASSSGPLLPTANDPLTRSGLHHDTISEADVEPNRGSQSFLSTRVGRISCGAVCVVVALLGGGSFLTSRRGSKSSSTTIPGSTTSISWTMPNWRLLTTTSIPWTFPRLLTTSTPSGGKNGWDFPQRVDSHLVWPTSTPPMATTTLRTTTLPHYPAGSEAYAKQKICGVDWLEVNLHEYLTSTAWGGRRGPDSKEGKKNEKFFLNHEYYDHMAEENRVGPESRTWRRRIG